MNKELQLANIILSVLEQWDKSKLKNLMFELDLSSAVWMKPQSNNLYRLNSVDGICPQCYQYK
jgi:hypothetical protein